MDTSSFPNIPGLTGITFDASDVRLPSIAEVRVVSCLEQVASCYGAEIGSLSYVLCSDAYLLEMNIERLQHDTLTDIITFDLRDSDEAVIDGECYISVERVQDNAERFGVSFERELLRVFVHGLLHLCGLGDKTAEEAIIMRAAEDRGLQFYFGEEK